MQLDKSNWKPIKLSDVVSKKEENDRENAHNRFDRFLKVEHMDAESLHIKRWADQEDTELPPTFYKIFRKGQVLFPTRNPHLRRTALASFDGICGEKTLTLESNEGLTVPEFVPFLFHSESFYDHTTAAIIGSTNPHCRWRDVANYEFLLPPKEQQSELAELLWAMDEVIEKELKVLESLKNQLRSCEKAFFWGNENNLVKLFTVVEKSLSGGTPNTKEPSFYSNGTIPWVTTKILNDDFIAVGENLITQKAIERSAAKLLPAGNILAGTRVGVGKFSINEIDISFSQDVIGLIIDNHKIDIEFLVYQLNSFIFQSKIKPLARGTTIKGVIKDDLLNLKVSLPNEDTQIKIRNELKNIKMAMKSIRSKINSSKSLQKSLINQIF